MPVAMESVEGQKQAALMEKSTVLQASLLYFLAELNDSAILEKGLEG